MNMATCDECNGWLNPALAVDAAVKRGDSILLIQRKYPPMQGYWGLPGGFVERDEDPLIAVIRELEEETGMVGENPELLMVMGNPMRDPRKHIVSIVYEVEVKMVSHKQAMMQLMQDFGLWKKSYRDR